jgi:YgiT-type zinc finger domain-containing protein
MTRCHRCDEGERVFLRRAKTAERSGHLAVVLDVPMEECPACGERYLSWEVAAQLDELLDAMLRGDAEVATRHFTPPTAA